MNINLSSLTPGDLFCQGDNQVLQLGPNIAADKKRCTIGVCQYGANTGVNGPGNVALIVFENRLSNIWFENISFVDKYGNKVPVARISNYINSGPDQIAPSSFRLEQDYPQMNLE